MRSQNNRSPKWGDNLLRTFALACCSWVLMSAAPAMAQVVQRSFVNQSFEVPYIDTANSGCHRTLPANWIPGWASTEAASLATGFNSSCPETGTFVPPTTPTVWNGTTPAQTSTPPFPIPVGSRTQNMIQLFHETYGVNAVQGDQWAELNADSNARLYQEMCMVTGEVVDWSLSHRARGNTSGTPETMEFNIGPNTNGSGSTLIMRGASYTDGTDSTTPASVCPGGLGTCTRTRDATTGWVTYQGRFTWTASGQQSIGFQAIYGQAGSTNAGNYLDNVNLTLKPFLQFSSATFIYT